MRADQSNPAPGSAGRKGGNRRRRAGRDREALDRDLRPALVALHGEAGVETAVVEQHPDPGARRADQPSPRAGRRPSELIVGLGRRAAGPLRRRPLNPMPPPSSVRGAAGDEPRLAAGILAEDAELSLEANAFDLRFAGEFAEDEVISPGRVDRKRDGRRTRRPPGPRSAGPNARRSGRRERPARGGRRTMLARPSPSLIRSR